MRESSDLATVHYVRQGDPKGLGHAVLCAAQHVGDEPFAVLLGDDLIDSRDPLLTRMIEVRKRYGGSVVALMEVDPEQVSQYGCAAISPTGEDGRGHGHRPGGEAGARLGAEQLDPDRPVRVRPGRCSTCCARPRPAAAARSSSPTRC